MRKNIQLIKIHALLALCFVAFRNCGRFETENKQNDFSSVLTTDALKSKYAYGKSGLRRLTTYEVVNSATDVFGVDASSVKQELPYDENQTIPFANEYAAQAVAPITIEAYLGFAEKYSNLVVKQADFPTRFAQIAGCTPKNPADRDCLISYLQKVGPKILRRPFTLEEAQLYADRFVPIASSESSFATAVELSIQAFLQNASFLYRVEIGTGIPVEPGLIALNDYEIASQLSYLILGSTPDDGLLEKAQNGLLSSPSVRVAEALRLLQQPRAKEQWHRFHAQWLGYEAAVLPPSLEADMHQESNMLVSRIVFQDNSDWLNLFRSNQSYLTPALAQQYGIKGVTTPAWVTYGTERGGGILAHATFLSQGSKFGDTSPTRRGYEIYKRIMCGKLGQIPDSVDPDNPPGNPSDCKTRRYSMRQMTACASCHNVTDNLGWGLENLGAAGEWRVVEPGNPSCAIENDGMVGDVPYSGPRALGATLANDPRVSQCAVTQLFRFYTGRLDSKEDQATLYALNTEYLLNRTLKSLVLALVESPAFIHRVQ